MKQIISILSLSGCLLATAAGSELGEAMRLTPGLIAELAGEARTNNSALRAARSRIGAAQAHARSIPVWKNPDLVAGGVAAERAMRADDGDVIYGVEQELPVFGKSQAARRAAQAAIPAEEANLEAQAVALHRDLAQALIQAALADELLDLAREDLAWLSLAAQTVEERYRAGTATQSEVLRLLNERSRRADRLLTEEADRENAFVTVNRLLNRNANSAWARLGLPPLSEPLGMGEALAQQIIQREPRLHQLRREESRAQAVVESTRKEGRPDLSIAAEARHYSGSGEARSGAVLFKLSLPWLNRRAYRSAVEREEARAEEARQLADDRIYEITAELHHLTAKIDAARREAVLNRNEITPRSEQALEAAHSAWVAGTGGLREVLEVRRMLIESRTGAWRALAEQHTTLWELAALAGLTELESLHRIASHHSPLKP